MKGGCWNCGRIVGTGVMVSGEDGTPRLKFVCGACPLPPEAEPRGWFRRQLARIIRRMKGRKR